MKGRGVKRNEGERSDHHAAPQMQEVNAQLQREKEAEIQRRQTVRSTEQAGGGGAGGAAGGKGWNEEDLQLLIKAVNLFPAGTNAR